MESIIETKASTMLQFFAGSRGDLRVTFEEGTWAAWLYERVLRLLTVLHVLVLSLQADSSSTQPVLWLRISSRHAGLHSNEWIVGHIYSSSHLSWC